MSKILLVEDHKLFGKLIKNRVEADLGAEVTWCQTLKETADCLNTARSFFAGIVDLNLPDAENGEAVDLVKSHEIPIIVCTGSFNKELRKEVWSKSIVDYVWKESTNFLEYLTALLQRIGHNENVKVLVVDDSDTARYHLCTLMKTHHYEVLEAASGDEALNILSENSDTTLVITDYDMPGMNGFELTDKIRSAKNRNDLAIIGISASNDDLLSARFLKSGANDFLSKPFSTEEFYCRVAQNVEMVQNTRALRQLSNTDALTQLYNRRYLFEVSKKLFASDKRGHLSLTVAMIDIDYFKRVNDKYGHAAGDLIIKQVAAQLRERFRESDIVARFGGEEFCILVTNMEPEHTFEVFDGLRRTIEGTKTCISKDQSVSVTVSIGVALSADSMDKFVKKADDLLYDAKKAGRNQVIIAE